MTEAEHIELLDWYINLVGECEGVDFIPNSKPDELSKEQWDILRTVANSARNSLHLIPGIDE